MRYQQQRVLNNELGNRHFSTTLMERIEPSSEDIYLYSRYGDRLDQMAYHYYGDVQYWWIIAVNNAVGKGTLYLEPGKQIRIPDPNRIKLYIDKFTLSNSLR